MRCFISSVLFAGFAASANAQVALSVAPIRLELTGQAAENLSDSISVTNEGSEKVRIRVRVSDWLIAEDGAVQFDPSEPVKLGCTPWIRVNPREFELNAGQSTQVRYTLDIPKEAPASGFRSSILFETIPAPMRGERKRSVLFQGRIATLVYLVVGKVAPNGKLIAMEASSTKTGTSIQIKVENIGQVHFRTAGTVQVLDAGGKVLIDEPVGDLPVLPEGIRRIEIKSAKALEPGNYKAQVRLNVGMPAVLVGEKPFTVAPEASPKPPQ